MSNLPIYNSNVFVVYNVDAGHNLSGKRVEDLTYLSAALCCRAYHDTTKHLGGEYSFKGSLWENTTPKEYITTMNDALFTLNEKILQAMKEYAEKVEEYYRTVESRNEEMNNSSKT